VEKGEARVQEASPLRVADPGKRAFVDYLPVYSLRAAAGGFSDAQEVEVHDWVNVAGQVRMTRDLFVANVEGKSMEPLIPDGSLCVFRKFKSGSRQGRIVLVQNADLVDPEHGGTYTAKKYNSEKVFDKEGDWLHSEIILSPLNHEYQAIQLTPEDENTVSVIAEFVCVLKI
jgi:phage repressor protein C with HTH and peptisase S24 domain